MIIVPCFNCYTAVRVMGESSRVAELVGEESDFWPDSFRCVSCGKRCEGLSEDQVEPEALARMKVKELGPEEMLAAQEGFGVPEEMLCTSGAVRELFAKKVKTVHGRDVRGTSRFIIDHIEFEDGVKMYLAASPSGAVVYRISRPHSYTEKVLEETSGSAADQ